MTNASIAIQDSLGIKRRRRKEGDQQEGVVEYIECLKSQAKTILDKRLKVLTCPACNIVLGKYHVYVLEKGEVGAIIHKDKPIEKISYAFTVECSKCFSVVTVDQTGQTRIEDKSHESL